MFPESCPHCKAKLVRRAINLAEGEDHAILVFEMCSENIGHYRHYREATFEELREGIH